MRKKSKLILFDFLLIAVLLVIDQLTKYWAITKLKDNEPIAIIKNVLELNYLENRGSAFGMLQNQKVFILFVGFVFMALILYFLIKLPDDKKYNLLYILFAGIIAGGIGNMIDRFRFDFVVDFISFVLIHFPIFNVADCYIVVCVILLFIMFMFVYKEKDLEFLSFKHKKEAEE